MSMYGNTKVDNLLKQATSLHIINFIYMVGLIVVLFFTLNNDSLNLALPEVIYSSVFLCFAIFFKLYVFLFNKKTKEHISLHEAELFLATINILTTYMLNSVVEQLHHMSSVLLLFSAIVPTLWCILIYPYNIFSEKFEFKGFFAFIQWLIFSFVVYWSFNVYYLLIQEEYWWLLSSNIIIALSPIVLNIIKRQHINKLKDKMHQEIYIDPLTGVKNRKCFYDYYDHLREKNKLGHFKTVGLGVIFVDIDYFKQYNDYYGHNQGDVCLSMVADYLEVLAEGLPQSTVFRYGGEEFLVCTLCTKEQWNSLTSHGIMNSWSLGETFFKEPHNESPKEVVSISAGGVWHNSLDIYKLNAGEITKTSDKLLYKAKEDRALLIIQKTSL